MGEKYMYIVFCLDVEYNLVLLPLWQPSLGDDFYPQISLKSRIHCSVLSAGIHLSL